MIRLFRIFGTCTSCGVRSTERLCDACALEDRYGTNGSDLVVVRQTLIDAADAAGTAASAFSRHDKQRAEAELHLALRSAARAVGFNLVSRRGA